MAAANTIPCTAAKSPCAVAPRPDGTAWARKCMVPRWVAPNVSACRPCSKGSTAAGGSNAIEVHRTTPPRPPSRIIPLAPTRGTIRPDAANSPTSMTTASAHSGPIAVPPMPRALHGSVAKPCSTAWLAWIRLAPSTTATKPGERRRGRRREGERRHDGPDHLAGAEPRQERAAAEIRDDEGHRAPQPYRPVAAHLHLEPAQRNRIG